MPKKKIDFTRGTGIQSHNTGGSGILSDISRSQNVRESRIQQVAMSDLRKDPLNEEVYSIDTLDALVLDIKERGIQQPLIVTAGEGGCYIIISGHRRFAAAQIASGFDNSPEEKYIPCIVKSQIPLDIDEGQALEHIILDNLQRKKSDYERMMEIITFKKCIEIRKMRGEDIVNIRKFVIDRLDTSNGEISRYEKIYHCINPSFLNPFKEGFFSTNVAYELAKLDHSIQIFVYDNMQPLLKKFLSKKTHPNHPQEEDIDFWNEGLPQLTITTMTAVVAQYTVATRNATQDDGNTSETTPVDHSRGHMAESDMILSKNQKKSSTQTGSAEYRSKSMSEGSTMHHYVINSFKDGWCLFSDTYSHLSTHLVEGVNLTRREEQLLIKKITKQVAELTSLQRELELLGLLSINEKSSSLEN